MAKRVWSLLVLLLLAGAGGVARGETLTFDDNPLGPDQPSYPILYEDQFTIYNFYAAGPPSPFPGDNTPYADEGYYPFAPPAYPYPTLTDNNGVMFYTGDQSHIYIAVGDLFTLNSLQIVSDYSSDPGRILGYREGVLVDTAFGSAADPTTGLLTLDWTGIDAVVFPDSYNNPASLDNVRVNEPVGAAVPEPGSLVLVGSGVLAALLRGGRWRRVNR